MPTHAPFVHGHPMVVVWGLIDGVHELKFLVDSGAAYILVSRDFAVAKGIALEEPFRQEELVSVERGGLRVNLGRIRSLGVGSVVLNRVEGSIVSLPSALGVDGILGLSFLRHFRVTFEFDRATVVLREFPPAGRPASR